MRKSKSKIYYFFFLAVQLGDFIQNSNSDTNCQIMKYIWSTISLSHLHRGYGSHGSLPWKQQPWSPHFSFPQNNKETPQRKPLITTNQKIRQKTNYHIIIIYLCLKQIENKYSKWIFLSVWAQNLSGFSLLSSPLWKWDASYRLQTQCFDALSCSWLEKQKLFLTK